MFLVSIICKVAPSTAAACNIKTWFIHAEEMDNFSTTNILSYSSLNKINKVEFMLARKVNQFVHILWLIIPIFWNLLFQKMSYTFLR
jgi:hypothetical protein